MSRSRPVAVVVSCEHGGAEIPAAYRHLFSSRAARAALASHRGFDAGALPLARELAAALRAPLHATTVSRLLVDCNRSAEHRRVFSEWTAGLDAAERAALLRRYHAPHHRAVERRVARGIAAGARVVHVSVHSFTPVFGGRVRDVDVGVLYDPRRTREARFARELRDAIADAFPELRVALNRPYRGWTDGLTTTLRGRFGDRDYAGVELEVNQGVVGRRDWGRRRGVLVAGVVATLRRGGSDDSMRTAWRR